MRGGGGERPPRLSVVIPYYMGAATISEAVGSAVEQTLAPDEIVVCDDGSPDDLEGALGPLADAVKIVHKRNGGISSAMNAATEAATGDFLVQLDQDDAFLPGRLEAVAGVIEGHPGVDLVATDAVVEYEGSPVARLAEVNPFQLDGQRLAILASPFFLWPAIRRSRLIAVGGYDESFPVMQDWECFIRLVLDGAEIAWVPEALYRWRLTPGSRSSSDRLENAKALIRMMQKTLHNPDLSADERAAAERALASHRRRLALERAHLALDCGAPSSRRLSAELLTGRGFSLSTRAKAAIALASPGVARRFVAARERRDPGAEALARRGFRRPG
jgi:Glycosyl transferase family 2